MHKLPIAVAQRGGTLRRGDAVRASELIRGARKGQYWLTDLAMNFDGRRCLTLSGPAAAKRQPSGAPATRNGSQRETRATHVYTILCLRIGAGAARAKRRGRLYAYNNELKL